MQIKELSASNLFIRVGAKLRHGGIYGQACSRSGRFGAFSGRRVGPGLWLRLRLRRSTALRLRGYGIRLRSTSLCTTGPRRNDRYYRDANSGLHSATGGLRTRLLGRIRWRIWLGRIRKCGVLGALTTRKSDSLAHLAQRGAARVVPCAARHLGSPFLLSGHRMRELLLLALRVLCLRRRSVRKDDRKGNGYAHPSLS
jgi:hypothetical protein